MHFLSPFVLALFPQKNPSRKLNVGDEIETEKYLVSLDEKDTPASAAQPHPTSAAAATTGTAASTPANANASTTTNIVSKVKRQRGGHAAPLSKRPALRAGGFRPPTILRPRNDLPDTLPQHAAPVQLAQRSALPGAQPRRVDATQYAPPMQRHSPPRGPQQRTAKPARQQQVVDTWEEDGAGAWEDAFIDEMPAAAHAAPAPSSRGARFGTPPMAYAAPPAAARSDAELLALLMAPPVSASAAHTHTHTHAAVTQPTYSQARVATAPLSRAPGMSGAPVVRVNHAAPLRRMAPPPEDVLELELDDDLDALLASAEEEDAITFGGGNRPTPYARAGSSNSATAAAHQAPGSRWDRFGVAAAAAAQASPDTAGAGGAESHAKPATSSLADQAQRWRNRKGRGTPGHGALPGGDSSRVHSEAATRTWNGAPAMAKAKAAALLPATQSAPPAAITIATAAPTANATSSRALFRPPTALASGGAVKELVFPSPTTAAQGAVAQRQVVIPAEFDSVAQYATALQSAMNEHINNMLLDLGVIFNRALATLDTSALSCGAAGRRAVDANTSAPHCSHGRANLRTVKKDGPNKGRAFYGCPQPRQSGCSFFQWADEEVTSSANGGSSGPTVRRTRVRTFQELEEIMQGRDVNLFAGCTLHERGRGNMDGGSSSSSSNAGVELMLGLTGKRKIRYAKGDVWVVSTSLNFEPQQTFVAISSFFGPTADLSLGIRTVSGYRRDRMLQACKDGGRRAKLVVGNCKCRGEWDVGGWC